MSGYLRHIELSRQLEERAKEASRTRQLSEERLEELTALFKTAKRSDCKLGEAEDLLAQANSALAAKDYRLALEKTKDGEDKVKAAFLQRVQSILGSAEPMLDLLRRTGEDVSEYEVLIGTAKEALDKGNFEEAVETAKRGWTKGEKTLHKYLSKSFSSAQAFILAAKAMDKDTAIAEDLLSKARAALEASDYQDALSQTEEALDLLGRELDFELVEERKALDKLMETGKALEADLSKAKSYLAKFDGQLENSNYEKAFNFLKQAKIEAERQLKKTIEAGGVSLEAPIDEARKLGADTSTAEGLSEEVRRAADEGDYGTASRLIEKGLQELENAKFQRVLQTISLSRPKFLQARKIGAEAKSAIDIFNKARQALQEGDFKDALYSAEKGNEVLDQLIQEFESHRKKMKTLAEEVRFFSEGGLKLSEVEGLLRTAEEELSQGNLESLSSLIQRIEKDLKGARSERGGELLKESQFLLTFAEKAGLNVAAERGSQGELSQALKAGETGEALQGSMSLKTGLEERISSHLRARIDEIQKVLPGEDMGEVHEVILKATTALDVKDFETSLRMLEEVDVKAENIARERSSTILEALRAAQELSTDHGLETYGLREAHLAAKRAFDDGNFQDVFNQLRATKEQLADISRKAFDMVKARVIEARDVGIGIEEMKEKLIEAKNFIDEGEVVRGLIFLRECDLSAKEVLEVYQKVHDITASAAAIIAEGKKKDVDMARAVELLIKGKTTFEGGNLERALDFALDARAEAEKQISVLNVTDRILAAKESLDLAQMLEVDVSVFTNLLRRAKQSLDARDFREAVELAMETEEQAAAGVRDKINSKIARAETLLDKVQVPAKEVGELLQSISTAKSLLSDRKLREAAGLIQDTIAGCAELAEEYDKVLDVLKRAEGLASELQSMNVKVSGPGKLLTKAGKAYEQGNLGHAGQLAEEALSQLERKRDENIERTLKSFEIVVARAREDGVNTSTAEEHLKKARSLFMEGSYQDALAAAMNSETEVEKMALQKDIAENALETARTRIMALPKPVTSLRKMLKDAERAFEVGDYVLSLETAIAAGDELTKIRDNWEDLEDSEEKALVFYKIAERAEVEMIGLSTLLEKARQATEEGNLEESRELFDELSTQAGGLISSSITQLHTEVRNAVVMCSLLNCDVEGIDDKISQGRSYADEDRYDRAIEVLSKVKEELHGALRGKIGQLLSDSQEAADHAEKVGVDVQKARSMVEEARVAMGEGHIEIAIRLAQESLEAIHCEEKFHKLFMESTFETESLIKTAKKFGIDAKGAKRGLRRAFQLKESDPDGAIEEAGKALKQVQDSLEAFSPSLKMDLNLHAAAGGGWNDAVLRIRNTGKALAKDLEVEVMGDLEVQDLQTPATIRARGETEVRFQIMFNSIGSVPVLVKARVTRLLDDRRYEQEEVFDVSVDEDVSESGPEEIVAEFDSKCSLCRGSIKKGFTAKRCACSSLLHEPCANRAGKCPVCQRSL